MRYPTDLNQEQWNLIKDLFRKKTRKGAPRNYDELELVNAILYIVKTGAQWAMIPHDFPPKSTVYYYFQKFF